MEKKKKERDTDCGENQQKIGFTWVVSKRE